MNKLAAAIATVCECIDQCFAYEIWCEDFAWNVEPEELIGGLDRGHQLVSDATRLLSFLALRKVDDFLRHKVSRPDDLIASSIGIDTQTILKIAGGYFLTPRERTGISKKVAHLTDRLALDADDDIDLYEITRRLVPAFTAMIEEFRGRDRSAEAKFDLDRSSDLLRRFSQPVG